MRARKKFLLQSSHRAQCSSEVQSKLSKELLKKFISLFFHGFGSSLRFFFWLASHVKTQGLRLQEGQLCTKFSPSCQLVQGACLAFCLSWNFSLVKVHSKYPWSTAKISLIPTHSMLKAGTPSDFSALAGGTPELSNCQPWVHLPKK